MKEEMERVFDVWMMRCLALKSACQFIPVERGRESVLAALPISHSATSLHARLTPLHTLEPRNWVSGTAESDGTATASKQRQACQTAGRMDSVPAQESLVDDTSLQSRDTHLLP